MKKIKQKKTIGVLLAVLLILAGVAGAASWMQHASQDKARVELQTETVGGSEAVPKPVVEPEPSAPVMEEVDAQLVLPAADELVYTFEGTKLYIVAGSVTGQGNLWQAKVKSVTAQGKVGPERQVYFRAEGKDILTQAVDGVWQSADDMDRSIYRKVMKIAAKPEK